MSRDNVSSRETNPKELKLTAELYNLLEPPVAGFRFEDEGRKVLLYAMVPLEGLPAGILGAAGYWLYQTLGKPGQLGHLVYLLSKAVKTWMTERTQEIPIVG